MKTAAQLAESIERFKRVFWGRESHARPPVGVVNQDVYLPIRYLRGAFPRDEVLPDDVNGNAVMTDYEYAFANRPVSCDDWMPFSAAWRGIPWIEAACGCPVRFSTGSLAPEPCVDSLAALEDAAIPSNRDWLERLRGETARLAAAAPADCWVSPTILRGPSDVLAAMRGLADFYCDLYDNPRIVDRAAARINRLLLETLDAHFAVVPPKLGGYGHIFGYWAPGPTIAIQEDALGMCGPEVYRDIFGKYNARIVRHLGAHVLFHMHSTGFAHYRDVLAVEGLAGIQMTIEANGPPLTELLPVFREILERTRLVLFVDNRFDELPGILSRLPSEGLYLVIPERDLPGDTAFRAFVTRHWDRE